MLNVSVKTSRLTLLNAKRSFMWNGRVEVMLLMIMSSSVDFSVDEGRTTGVMVLGEQERAREEAGISCHAIAWCMEFVSRHFTCSPSDN